MMFQQILVVKPFYTAGIKGDGQWQMLHLGMTTTGLVTSRLNVLKMIMLSRMCSLILHKFMLAGTGSSVRCAPTWHEDGRGFDPRTRQHSFVEIGHEIISTAILPLPHFGRGPGSWASRLGSLPSPVTDNCPYWISGWERMAAENFMTNLHEWMLPDVRIDPTTVRIPGGRTSDRTVPGNSTECYLYFHHDLNENRKTIDTIIKAAIREWLACLICTKEIN